MCEASEKVTWRWRVVRRLSLSGSLCSSHTNTQVVLSERQKVEQPQTLVRRRLARTSQARN